MPVSDNDTGEQRQLVQALLGPMQERCRAREVCNHGIETSGLETSTRTVASFGTQFCFVKWHWDRPTQKKDCETRPLMPLIVRSQRTLCREERGHPEERT